MQVVSAAGAVDHSQLVQLAEKAFSGLPAEGLSSKEYIDKASSTCQTLIDTIKHISCHTVTLAQA